MSKLTYSAICSLDGYINDANGDFDWAAPDEEVHRFVNDLERPVGTYLLGRRMYEVMRFWDTPEAVDEQPDVMRDYARIWRAANKIVYSRSLAAVTAPRTRLEREFDVAAVRRLKADARSNFSVGGPGLAGVALTAGIVDEVQLFLVPIVVGGGTRALPDGVTRPLELLEQRRFSSGVVYLRYRINLDS